MKKAPLAPDLERMSLIMAVILIAYASARFVDFPTQIINIDVAGLFLPLRFNLNTIISILVAALAAAGADWLFQDQENEIQGTSQHWLLPALTAWIISLPLANLPLSPLWWFVFWGGGFLLLFIFLAEFVSEFPQHPYFYFSSVLLGALAFAIFLMLAISLRSLELRLILGMPALFFAATLISLRIQILRTGEAWSFPKIVAIAFIGTQIAAAINYWPISALSFGLLALGFLYAGNSLLTAITQGQDFKAAAQEPLIAMAAFIGISFFV